ncbi:hypothetical protein H0H81_007713 [Sphagnurus paluster]|uniref:Proteasome subunit alpha type 1 n=1 Tax=Sphagnurus paluster TaxID=117069 RepID=A0A9P7GND9_9AGAR|nr:hypothetical protein H0H81_007713 [Sphagnurus paluster]
MNKNPFVPQPSYTPQQPPLPPGPPPPQPAQPDYSAYWAAAAAQHQQPPALQQYTPQWTPPQPPPQPPRPPPEQSALYANYGYGSQWQRQQQQQQLQQLQAQQYHHPPPPIAQPPPQPPTQPGYNPYQPAAGYPQQYVPQPLVAPPQPMTQAYPHPQPQQPQQQFFPQHLQQQQQQQLPPQQRHQLQHTPPQHLPPAKRQRFDGPNSNRHNQNQHHTAPPQAQFQPPPSLPTGPYAGPQGPGRGGAPQGMNHIPMGPGRGGMGGRGGPAGVAQRGRGAPMSGARGAMAGGRGRGGGSGFIGGGSGTASGGPRGGGNSGPLRGHGSRGNFGGKQDYQNRRGGASGGGYNNQGGGSFRGRGGQHSGSNRTRHDASFTSRDGQSSSFGNAGKKDENRRTLTDFKIVGLEIRDISWTWGVLPAPTVKIEPIAERPMQDASEPLHAAKTDVKEETMDEEPIPSQLAAEDSSTQPVIQPPSQPETQTQSQVETQPDEPTSPIVADVPPPGPISAAPAAPETSLPSAPQISFEANAHTPPPSRIRIYFHTPVTADDSRPIPHNTSPSSSFTFGATPSDSRKGKRKKLEDDDGDIEEERARPPPPQMRGMSAESSVAASVTHTETPSEADWLMAAIVEGGEDVEGERDTAQDDAEDDEERHVTQIVEPTDNDDDLIEVALQSQSMSQTSDGNCMLGDVDMWAADGSATAAPEEAGEARTDGATDHETNAAHDGAGANIAPVVAQAPAEVAETAVVITDECAAIESAPAPALAPAAESSAPASSEPAPPPESSISDSIASSHNASSVPSVGEKAADADHSGLPDTQVLIPNPVPPFSPKQVKGAIKSLLAVSVEPTLLDIGSADSTLPPPEDSSLTTLNEQTDEQDETRTQTGDPDMTQEMDHLPEPPASPPTSNTLLSTSSTSTCGDSPTAPVVKPELKGKTPSANRLSISYAGGNRRLVVDAEVVESFKLFRQDGRIEVLLNIVKEGHDGLKGILVEGLSDLTKSYLPLQTIRDESESDVTLPPFSKLQIPSTLTLLVYLETARPLSEPKWAKSGDIQEWLKSMFGRMFWVAGDAAEGWEKKIQVVDPDPPPTIWTILDGWAANSPAGVPNERQRFLKTHMTETDNILEILLRLVRGERATASYQSGPAISAPSISGPLLSALSQGSAHGAQQTHVSLAVLAMFRMAVEYAKKAVGDKGKAEVEERVGEIIRCLPSHLVYKSLDGIFKEWRVEKKGR